MKGASAIGDTMQKLYQQNYLEQQDALKQQQIKDSFNFQKERANTQDTQWQTSFDAGRDDKRTANEQWQSKMLQDSMFHDDTVKYQNSNLGIHQQTADLAKEKANREAEEARAKGMYYATLHPEIAKAMGYTTQQTFQKPTTITNDPYATPNMSPVEQPIIPQQKQSAPNQIIKEVVDPKKAGAMAGIFDKTASYDKTQNKWVDLGDKQVLMTPTGEVIQTLSKGEKPSTPQTDTSGKASAIIKELNVNKAMFGEGTEAYAPQIMQDLTQHNQMGIFKDATTTEKNWIGQPKTVTKKVYVPYAEAKQGQTTQPTQQQIKIIPHTEAKNYGITFE